MRMVSGQDSRTGQGGRSEDARVIMRAIEARRAWQGRECRVIRKMKMNIRGE